MLHDSLWITGNKSPSATSAPWSRVQDKLFEQALVVFPEETYDRWGRIASEVPGKTAWEVRKHYQELVHDVSEIESGRVELPCYADDGGEEDDESFGTSWEASQISFGGIKSKQSESDRKKGTPWTEDEHKLFLIGLQKYGKGDWRSISRNAVVSRTPTQVASHAQKYYLRLNSGKKQKRRSSIHDITTVDEESVSQPSPQSKVPQFQNPVWETVQSAEPASVFPNQASSSGYQQQF